MKSKNKWVCKLTGFLCDFATDIFHGGNKWLDRLAFFLCAYASITFFWGYLSDTGVPFVWVLFVVFPSITIYKLFEWLWTR